MKGLRGRKWRTRGVHARSICQEDWRLGLGFSFLCSELIPGLRGGCWTHRGINKRARSEEEPRDVEVFVCDEHYYTIRSY